MSCRSTYSREYLQRNSVREKKKTSHDDSDKISMDPDVDSQVEVIDDSQPPLTGYRDLFGELIPTNTCKPTTNDKLIQKKVRSRKKKHEESFKKSPRRDLIRIPKSPRMIRIIKRSRSELYSSMGLNKSSNDVSNVSTDSLNISGIQQLPSSPIPKSQKVSNTNLEINKNNKELPQVLKATYSHEDLQRNSVRKKRKLAIDDSDKISMDPDVVSQVEVIDDSQPPLTGYRDLFGELIPTSTCKPTTNDKLIKKKKHEESFKISPRKNPIRIIIPKTPRIIRTMKESRSELYSSMGLNKSSNVSTDSLNVSGIQQLPSSPISKSQKVSNTDLKINKNNKELPQVLKGVIGFVDYKIFNDHSGLGVIHRLNQLGAKVEKTFNLKVTHVVFLDGYRKTYNTAISRKIPLVSATWMEDCLLSNKILDPVDYPPINIEKYTKERPINLKNLKRKYQKFCTLKTSLEPKDFERNEQFKLLYESFMRRAEQFDIDYPRENPEEYKIKEPVDPSSYCNCIIDALSDQINKAVNTEDNSMPDEQIDDMFMPTAIKTLRKCLTPKGKENKTPLELDIELDKIEDRLNLNSKARQRLRKLLFPSNKELHNLSLDINDVSDFTSPSPQKIRISAPSSLISKRKRKIVLDKEDKTLLPLKKKCN